MTTPVSAADVAAIEARFPELKRDLLTTDAVPLIDETATEEQWLAARRQGIGASELAVAMGRSPYSSPFALWHAKRGGWDMPRTEEQMVGLALENAVADIWARENAETYHVATPSIRLWGHPTFRWLMCTPDRLAVSADGRWIPVEVKTDEGGKEWGSAESGDIPFHHRVQVWVQCSVFGAPYGYVARLGRKSAGRKYTTYRVDYDPAAFAECLAAGEKFMASVRADEEPEIDAHKATTAALEQLYPMSADDVDVDEVAVVPAELASQWVQCRENARQAKRLSVLVDNRMRAAMGSAGVAMTPDGQRIVKRSVYERSGYVAKPSMVDQLRRIEDNGSAE